MFKKLFYQSIGTILCMSVVPVTYASSLCRDDVTLWEGSCPGSGTATSSSMDQAYIQAGNACLAASDACETDARSRCLAIPHAHFSSVFNWPERLSVCSQGFDGLWTCEIDEPIVYACCIPDGYFTPGMDNTEYVP